MDNAGVTKWQTHTINYTRSYPDLLSVMPSIIAKYAVLIYSGDFDGQIPHRATEEWTSGLNIPEKESFRPWVLQAGGEVAGYVRLFPG